MSKYFVWAYDDYEARPGFSDCKGIFDEFDEADERALEFVSVSINVDIYRISDNNTVTIVKWWRFGEMVYAKDYEHTPRRGMGLPLSEERVKVEYE